uniref:Uncharacterized protein n=1 Tax=Utricularia reniformis TaxID=192314 RepID=A0A1Y0B0V5_9LAMI|nr:hypothetical protein AEK19_MT0801 [Utricularia reniformis]ART31040.1 hypothetical protein AEK19_MT0801 [Utricularia reniformis]
MSYLLLSFLGCFTRGTLFYINHYSLLRRGKRTGGIGIQCKHWSSCCNL